MLTECADSFESVFFMFSEMWIEITPSEYVKDVSEAQDGTVCMLLFMPFEQEIFLLGSPIFMNYYATHQDPKGQIIITPHNKSNKSTL